MAAIISIDATQQGGFVATPATLSADDTITFSAAKKQLMYLHNPTGGPLTATIDGDAGTTVNCPGVGPVTVSAGYAVALTAGLTKAVVLSTVSAYCQSVVHLTGGAGIEATLFDL